jgi:prepilin-type N-terminal cleavage/methylation domain-containing protein
MNRQKRKSIRTQNGFTLLEATMAMVILAIAASGIFMAFAAAASVQTEAQRRILASRLAADQIEKIAATGYDQIQASYPVGYSQTAADRGNTGDAYANLSCSVVAYNNVTVSTGGNAVNLIQVTVSASYGITELTRITTLIGDKTKH